MARKKKTCKEATPLATELEATTSSPLLEDREPTIDGELVVASSSAA